MSFIALIPGAFAFWWASARTPGAAFLDVYLPVLLLLPDYYRFIAPGLPDPSFGHAAILPIAAAWLVRGKRWQSSLTDVFAFGFCFSVAYSEYLNAGYKEAQNLIFDVLCWMLLPYVLAKSLIEPEGLRKAFAKRFVFLLFCISIIAVYEFRFATTPFRLILDPFFPGQGSGWVTTFRYGLARIAGPYGHAILAGIILIAGYRIQRWLEWVNAWEPSFKYLPLPKARAITFGLLAGVIMTLVRGPWLAGMIGGVIAFAGRTRNPRAAMRLIVAAVVLTGIPAGIAFQSYVSVGRAGAKSVSQETAAYRKELVDKYVGIAMEKSVWGWGRNTWPRVPGMPSIDNQYLLLALMHGCIALGCFVVLLLYMVVRLLLRGVAEASVSVPGGSLALTLAAIYVVFGISAATVYMGNQVYAILFIISGWADAYLRTDSPETGAEEVPPAIAPAFRRVIV